jgi:glycosyltransferase involved in cell wall biosynthesis
MLGLMTFLESGGRAVRPVRVLIVTRALATGDRSDGIENFVRGFVQNMPGDFAVEVCGVGDDEAAGSGWQSRAFAGREIRYLPVSRAPSGAGSFAKARAVLGLLRARRRLNTTGRVVQVHYPAFDLGLIGRRSPIVRVVHLDVTAAHGRRRALHAGIGMRWLERLSFRRAARVYFVNPASYEAMAAPDGEGEGEGRMAFLPNFVEPSVFHRLPSEERRHVRSRLAGELGLPADQPWILFAGRLVARKRPQLAVAALAAASGGSAARTAHLVIAGDGDERAEVERQAREAGVADRVHFLGAVAQERLARLMQASDALLLTSLWEGGGMVIFEALAAGLPVVTVPVGAAPSVVAHASTGWIVESDTDDGLPSGLAAGLDWALAQDRDAVAERCASSVEKFHSRTVLEPFYDAHRELAGHS